MSDFLNQMYCASEVRVQVARARESLEDLARRVADMPPAPALTVGRFGFDIIAEIKRRSPAVGALSGPETSRRETHREIADRAACYAQGGACAISVLTEPSRFDGCLSHLSAASAAVEALGVPVMRKDFLVDPYQIFEARAAGAGGVLLITRMLSDEQLGEMLDAAATVGLFVLVEAFDGDDLARGCRFVGRMPLPALLGVNTRDLKTLTIDMERLNDHVGRFAVNSVPVAESGVQNVEDADTVARLGYRMALVGTALMQAVDPAVLLRSMLETGRRVFIHQQPGRA